MRERTRYCAGCKCDGRVVGHARAVGRFQPDGPTGYTIPDDSTVYLTRGAAEAAMTERLFLRCSIATPRYEQGPLFGEVTA